MVRISSVADILIFNSQSYSSTIWNRCRTLRYLFCCLQQNVKDRWSDNEIVRSRVVRWGFCHCLVLYTTLIGCYNWLYARVGIYFTYGCHLAYIIYSLRPFFTQFRFYLLINWCASSVHSRLNTRAKGKHLFTFFTSLLRRSSEAKNHTNCNNGLDTSRVKRKNTPEAR